jgi:hypothetical protein
VQLVIATPRRKPCAFLRSSSEAFDLEKLSKDYLEIDSLEMKVITLGNENSKRIFVAPSAMSSSEVMGGTILRFQGFALLGSLAVHFLERFITPHFLYNGDSRCKDSQP